MAKDPQLLTDIRLRLQHAELRPVYSVDAALPDASAGRLVDFATVSGLQNLEQAIFLRLLTPVGELAPLGHPDYGSRLNELIGRQNTATTRNLAKLFILESLQLEPRIEKIGDITVDPAPGTRDRVNISVQIKPVGVANTVTIGPFTLELEK